MKMDFTLNKKVKQSIKLNGLTEPLVAYELGLHRTTISGWLSVPLSKKHYQQLQTAISKLVDNE